MSYTLQVLRFRSPKRGSECTTCFVLVMELGAFGDVAALVEKRVHSSVGCFVPCMLLDAELRVALVVRHYPVRKPGR